MFKSYAVSFGKHKEGKKGKKGEKKTLEEKKPQQMVIAALFVALRG